MRCRNAQRGMRDALRANILACRSRSRSSNQVRRRSRRQCAPRSSTPSATAQRAGARARRHARAVAVRLSARRPAAAPGVPRRVRARARGARGRSARHDGRSSAFPSATTAARYNALAVLRDGRVDARLPQAVPAQLHGVRRGALLRARAPRRACSTSTAYAAALIICEDVWFAGPARRRRRRAREMIVVANGSPYHTRQQALRAASR